MDIEESDSPGQQFVDGEEVDPGAAPNDEVSGPNERPTRLIFVCLVGVFAGLQILTPPVATLSCFSLFTVFLLLSLVHRANPFLPGFTGNLALRLTRRLMTVPADLLVLLGMAAIVVLPAVEMLPAPFDALLPLVILLLSFFSAFYLGPDAPIRLRWRSLSRRARASVKRPRVLPPDTIEAELDAVIAAAEDERARWPDLHRTHWETDQQQRFEEWLVEEVRRFTDDATATVSFENNDAPPAADPAPRPH